MTIFADVDNPSTNSVLIALIGLLTVVVNWLVMRSQTNRSMADRAVKDAQQTETIKAAVVETTAPIAEGMETVKKQTNGQMQDAIKAAVAEALAEERAKRK